MLCAIHSENSQYDHNYTEGIQKWMDSIKIQKVGVAHKGDY